MLDKLGSNKLFAQVVKFTIVSIIATAIDYIVFFMLHEVFDNNILLSNIISFTVAIIFNYFASVNLVFNVKKSSQKKQFPIFVGLSLVGLLLNTATVYFTMDNLGIKPHILCKIIGTVIVIVFNFVTRKLYLEKK